MTLSPGMNRRHRRASMTYALRLTSQGFNASLSCKAAMYMLASIERARRRWNESRPTLPGELP